MHLVLLADLVVLKPKHESRLKHGLRSLLRDGVDGSMIFGYRVPGTPLNSLEMPLNPEFPWSGSLRKEQEYKLQWEAAIGKSRKGKRKY